MCGGYRSRSIEGRQRIQRRRRKGGRGVEQVEEEEEMKEEDQLIESRQQT